MYICNRKRIKIKQSIKRLERTFDKYKEKLFNLFLTKENDKMSFVSQNAEKRVKSPVESKNDCEVSSSSKINESKSLQISKVEIKENTEITKNTLRTSKSASLDTSKMTDSKNGRPDMNKTNSEQINRNPLSESTAAATVSNNETNRKMSVANENKSPKTSSTNAQNEANNNNNSNNNNNNNNSKLRARSGQSKKPATSSPTQSMSACGWCMDRKPILKYILPTLSGENLLFCTENCIAEFRKAVKRGACKQCGNAVRPTMAPNKEFCSTFCLNKAMPKNGTYQDIVAVFLQ